jgi:hypothetical protein
VPSPQETARARDEPSVLDDVFALPPGPAAFDVRVGAWAEYLVRSRGTKARMRISVLEAEPTTVTVEVAAFGTRGLPFVARLRFRTEALAANRRCLTHLDGIAVYLLGAAPLDLPVTAQPFRETCAPIVRTDVRPVNVTVPAGTFAAEESRGGTERVWIARDVPLWGLVRAEGRGGRAELVAFGWNDARSFIPVQGTGSDKANE